MSVVSIVADRVPPQSPRLIPTETQIAWADRCMDLALHTDGCASCRDGRPCRTYAVLRAAEHEAWNNDREARGLPRLAILPILGGIRLEAVR